MSLDGKHVREVCKIGQGKDCCRYLVCGASGFECQKLGALKGVIDSKVMYMTAQSDNCEGVRNDENIKKEN